MMKNQWPVAKLIAHRGASALSPENTIASLEKAYELGATWIEADVRLTLDYEAIMFHDQDLARCTNGRGLVRRTPYAVIANLDAGGWFSPKYHGERIPTLDQWLQAAAKRGLGIILDLKGSWFEARRLADQVSVLLSRRWPAHLPRPIISSDSPAMLRAMAAQQLNWNLSYIMRGETSNWQKIINKLHCISVHINHQFISEYWIQQLLKEKLHIAAYTVNDPVRAQQLFEMGIESVFTDDPRLLSPDFTPGH